MYFFGRQSVAVMLLCALAVAVRAQSMFGNIVGTVQDQSHASVPQANVKIRNLDDNSVHASLSGDDGSFEVLNLKAGRYTISILKEGFAEYTVGSLQLDSRQTVRVEATLVVASAGTSVQVAVMPA